MDIYKKSIAREVILFAILILIIAALMAYFIWQSYYETVAKIDTFFS